MLSDVPGQHYPSIGHAESDWSIPICAGNGSLRLGTVHPSTISEAYLGHELPSMRSPELQVALKTRLSAYRRSDGSSFMEEQAAQRCRVVRAPFLRRPRPMPISKLRR